MTSSIRTWLAQSPPVEWGAQQARELVLGALRQGPVPQHIAFVMDGNRRFARSQKKEVIEGHNMGFEALARTLEVCYKIGVKTVTVYAFSIENFKRTRYEVDALMDMAKVKLSQLAQHGELLQRYGAKIEFLGQRDMIRPDVLEAIDKAIDMTSGNGDAILNICAPYTSRDEITAAIRSTVQDFSEPTRHRLKRPFSETHIARNIRAQRLSTVTEGVEPHGIGRDSRAGDESALEDLAYKPTTAETKSVYEQLTKLVAKLLDEAADEHTATADESVVEGATDSIIAQLKDTSYAEEDKLAEVNDILDSDLSKDELASLQALADKLHDYIAPADQTTVSESTTLNNNGDRNSSPYPPNYPDPESISADTLTARTFTGLKTPPLDILIRTSGVERLSDFMLWQCHQDTEISFLDCMWPEFDLWHFLPVILEWQWRRRKDKFWPERHPKRRKTE